MCKRSNVLSRPVLMLRGLDGYFDRGRFGAGQRAVFKLRRELGRSPLSVVIARGPHLFPFRTEQLSPTAPMVLGPHGPGRVGRRRFLTYEPLLPERLVVVEPRAPSSLAAVADAAAREVLGGVETARLRLERWRPEHAAGLAQVNADPEVL